MSNTIRLCIFLGEQIMSQLTGFGHQSISPNFQQQMDPALHHQHNINPITHQTQASLGHQQGAAAMHQPNMAQPNVVSNNFTGQDAVVPYVKIIEQPAGNKLRFR